MAAKTKKKADSEEPTLPLPEWAKALKARRGYLGKTQDGVALDSGLLNQTTISELEGAKYEIGNLTAARLAALARGLDWSLRELEVSTGVDFGLSAYSSSFRTEDARDGAVPLIKEEDVEVLVYGMAVANPDGNVATARPIARAKIPPYYMRNSGRAYLVLGDSMDDGTTEGIRDGDVVMCDHGDMDLYDGKIFIVKVGGNGILLKRVRVYEDGETYLESDNKKYRPIRPDEAQVIGRVYYHKPAGRAL